MSNTTISKTNTSNNTRVAPYSYEIYASGYGGEFVAGHVSSELAAYWKKQPALVRHQNAFQSVDCPDSVPANPEFDLAEWSEFDDIVHTSGIDLLDEHKFVVSDARGKVIAKATFENDLRDFCVMNEKFCSRELDDQRPLAVAHTYEQLSYSFRVETDVPFQLQKLSIKCVDFEGRMIVDHVTYDGKELEMELEYSRAKADPSIRIVHR